VPTTTTGMHKWIAQLHKGVPFHVSCTSTIVHMNMSARLSAFDIMFSLMPLLSLGVFILVSPRVRVAKRNPQQTAQTNTTAALLCSKGLQHHML